MGTQIQAETQSIAGAWPHPRLRRHAGWVSRYLPGERDITVYLPPGYNEDLQKSYPLLIMQDGQNLFDPETSFVRGRTWRMAESADKAIAESEAEPLVIAGVGHAGERRIAEYTPVRDWKLGGGEAAKYEAMVVGELLPFLRAEYRVRMGPGDTGIGGSSLGGLVALWMGLRNPEVFGRLAVLSPSVWWNNRCVLGTLQDAPLAAEGRPRVWLDIGEAEGRRAVTDVGALEAQMRARGWRRGVDLHYERIAGGTHDEAAWAERVRPMLGFLFPAAGKEDGRTGSR